MNTDCATDSNPFPSFFTSNSTCNFAPEKLSTVGSYELYQALQTPRESNHAAEWLFSKSNHHFHGKHATLPPESFTNALACHMKHNITPVIPDCSSNTAVTKDVDMLFVPVAKHQHVTCGYGFMSGVYSVSGMGYNLQKPLNQFVCDEASNAKMQMKFGHAFLPPPALTSSASQFVLGRFVFNHASNDFLYVSTNRAQGITAIISMRWKNNNERDQAFFVVPADDYTPTQLPSKVITVQSNVDKIVKTDQQPETIEEQFPNIQNQNLQQQKDINMSPNLSQFDSDLNIDHQIDEPPDDINQHPLEQLSDQFQINQDQPGEQEIYDAQWPNFLDSIGMYSDDTSALFSNLLNGMDDNQQKFFEELEKIFNDNNNNNNLTVDNINSNSVSTEKITPHPDLVASPLASSLVSDIETIPSVTSVPTEPSNQEPIDMEEDDVWFLNDTTPDGISLPRRPASNTNTSASMFDFSTLADALGSIEASLQGSFYSNRIRKDTLHLQTGELVSRSTGKMNFELHRIQNPFQNDFLRQAAAQFYYSFTLPINADMKLVNNTNALITTQNQSSNGTQKIKKQAKTSNRRGRPVSTIRRPTMPFLAPRPIPAQIAPTVLPEAISMMTSASSGKEEKDAKLEAKRIKNRLSAAKSNQKRRTQLEAQKKELAILRRKVEELEEKKTNMEEDNERLKLKILSG